MKNEALGLMFSISLKARILREWQKSNRAEDQQFSERELLTLELIYDFAPITEKALSKIFGVPFSSVGDLVKKLEDLKLIGASRKARGEPLVLTSAGIECLAKLKQVSAVRFSYLFESLDDVEWAILEELYRKIDRNAEKTIQRMVFDRYIEVQN